MYETDARKLTQQVKDQSIELEKSQSKEPNKYSNNGNAREGERDLCSRNQIILIKSTKRTAGRIRQQR